MLKRMRVLLVVTSLMFSTITNAQVTTASISGRVTDANNEVIIGATVQAVHIASGTFYGVTTNVDGRFTIQGMRAGGFYKIEISYVGYETALFTGVTLQLGETANFSAKLKESSELLEEIVIIGRTGVDANKTGAAMSMNANQINRMPSISQGIGDILRTNPQINVSNGGAMSFAGTNNRYNSFQIDGAMNNDVFGLTGNGSNGGQAGTQPVSMETIEQIQVNVAPFDVRQSGFTGGAINAITKSGTNEFHGSVYGFGNNRDLIGSKYRLKNGKISEKYDKQSEYRYGATVGGPIIKNKLFFFANYEKANKEYPNGYGLGSAASAISSADAEKVLAKLKELATEQGVSYNGAFGDVDVYTKSDKAGVKLDWNINNKHKAAFRWSLVSATQLNQNSTYSNLNASDYQYDFASKTNSFVAELQSRLSDNISNEFRASYVRVRDERKPGDPFPMIEVTVPGGYVHLGNERSSMANSLDQDIWSFTDNLTWYKGKHTFTLGTHNEFYNFANLFIQDAYGTYNFNSVEDFIAGNIKRYRYSQANVDVTGNSRWKAEFGAGQLGFYVQDKWNATDKLDVTLGVRMDIPLFFDTPTENAEFNNYATEKGWNFRTDHKQKSTPMFSPRLGFRWNIDEENRIVLRGGAGVFTGRIPFVWLSNNFSNTGVQLSSYDTEATGNLSLILDPTKQNTNTDKLQASGSQVINVFDKEFKFVQNLRYNLGIDFQLGGVNWTAEAIYSKTLNDILYQNLARDLNGSKLGETFSSLSFDQRPMLSSVTTGTPFTKIYALSNTSKGYSYNLSLKGEKKFDFGLDVAASYTFTRSKSLNSGTSSVAASNWDYNYTIGNPNAPELGNSAFNRPHGVNVSVFYQTNYAKSWSSTVGLLYSGTSGSPYSVYYNGDLNGDGSNGNDLIFIPTDGQIDQMKFKDHKNYTPAEQAANMKSWLARDPYLSKHRGEYYKRNQDNEAFEHHFDFHFAQKYSFKVGNKTNSLEFTFDILNVGNLLNKKWGHYGSSGGSATYYNPIIYSGNGEFQFTGGEKYDMRSYSDYYSRWRGQLGLKYTF